MHVVTGTPYRGVEATDRFMGLLINLMTNLQTELLVGLLIDLLIE